MNPRLRLIAQCALIALVGGLIAFVLLAVLHARLGNVWVQHLDLGVQARVHGWDMPALTRVMRGLTFVGSIEAFIPTLIVAIFVLLMVGEREQGQRLVRKRQVSTIFGVAIGGAMIWNEAFKVYFHRARPKVPWSIGDEHTFSFPSGHSLFSMVLYGLIAYMVLGRRGRPLRHLLVVLAAALIVIGIGLSRIYLGMHWPTDVLAGYLTGGVWLCAVILIDRRWRTHVLDR
jgi:undecaprenyl-diphosphatase